jgi:CelD/BcsL family acetyltransferase involved in cellulose biosynthesis
MKDAEVTIIDTSQKMLEFKEEWEELWRDSAGFYLQEFAFCWQTWKSIHEPQRRGLRVAVLRQNGQPTALLPMVLIRKGPRKFACNLGMEGAEGCDVLVRRGYDSSPAAATLVWNEFLRQIKPHYVSLSCVKSDSLLHAAMMEGARYRVLEMQPDQIVCASLGGETEWETYEAKLSKSYRRQIDRKRRKLGEQGTVTFERVTGDIPFYIDWLLTEKRKWSEKTGKQGHWLYSSHFQECLACYAAASPQALVFVLKLDGRPVAVKVATVGPAICNLVIASYDEAYGKFSPGSILDEFLLEHIFTNYAREDGRHLDVDFGAGTEVYKLHWSQGRVVPAVSCRIATSWWAALPHYAKSIFKRPVNRDRDAHY